VLQTSGLDSWRSRGSCFAEGPSTARTDRAAAARSVSSGGGITRSGQARVYLEQFVQVDAHELEHKAQMVAEHEGFDHADNVVLVVRVVLTVQLRAPRVRTRKRRANQKHQRPFQRLRSGGSGSH